MDIQAVAVQDAPQKQASSPIVAPVADGSAVPATTASASSSTPVTATSANPTSSTATSSPPGANPPAKNDPLSSSIAKLFGSPDAPQQVDVQVSYRVDKYVNQIVTVFTDPRTGKEIAQFPKEIMIQIAQFFDKQSGVTLDRNA